MAKKHAFTFGACSRWAKDRWPAIAAALELNGPGDKLLWRASGAGESVQEFVLEAHRSHRQSEFVVYREAQGIDRRDATAETLIEILSRGLE